MDGYTALMGQQPSNVLYPSLEKVESYNDGQPIYFPAELVSRCLKETKTTYHYYLIELKQDFPYDVPVHDIVLAMRTKLESEIENFNFDMEVDGGKLIVNLKYVGVFQLTPEQVLTYRKFQITLFRVLMNRSVDKLSKIWDKFQPGNNLEMDYLLLPSNGQLIDWKSVIYCNNDAKNHVNCSMKGNARVIKTESGSLCTCMIHNSLVYTPHNGEKYCLTGVLEHLNANSLLRNRRSVTYKKHYEVQHGIQLRFDQESLLNGRHIYHLQNYLNKNRQQKKKKPSNIPVELPPELCRVILSPISLSTLYSFTFIPSIMHRLQSLLLAVNLKKMLLDHCMQNVDISTIEVLKAITTKNCQESYHLESLETLGDSFLKYAVSKQLFETYQNDQEGVLTDKRKIITSNVALSKLGCDHKLPGFIRTESFDPQNWMIPGDNSGSYALNEDLLSDTRKIYVVGRKKVKSDTVADVIEALIGAFLSTGGENAGLLFLDRIGIKVNFVNIPYNRQFQVHTEHFDVFHLESLLKYSFRDPSLLVESLTHGSCMLPGIWRSYQRLEFLGDAILDYLITLHLFGEYPDLSPGLLTDMRSASVNNECYALSSLRSGLHEHIVATSRGLQERIMTAVNNFEKLSLESTLGWQSESKFPRVLADIIESLAGAIFIDSGCNKEIVFQSIRPLLEPLITPKTMQLNPVRELKELCEKKHFHKKRRFSPQIDGQYSATIEVEANGRLFESTSLASNKDTAEKLASMKMLKLLKESIFVT